MYACIVSTSLWPCELLTSPTGLGVCGPSGRFKKALVKKIAEEGARWDDESISPGMRQTCEKSCFRVLVVIDRPILTSAALGLQID